MTVAELIAKLQNFPPDTEVKIPHSVLKDEQWYWADMVVSWMYNSNDVTGGQPVSEWGKLVRLDPIPRKEQ